ncbi:hypothetical protein KQ51_00680 [Candidatus Izimaplasma bacterium HR1]|uniref:DUF445 domain-containing protein n=1 Tax=Candidatus Izimoplasma sp. HR1 TaxID=1541959 RepID=UPI0004F627B5|nr:hypothetical protein KQ51_00680 [Candidatus Izimaplasma bacterium HR1]
MYDNIIRLLLMVVIGGLIGYLTNRIAIKMLFRPVNPIKILFFTIQGVFPKRKDQMAISLADTIEKELLSKEVIMDKILNDEKIEELKILVKDSLVSRIGDVIPPMVKMFLGSNPDEFIKNIVDKEGDSILDGLVEDIKGKGLDDLNIREIVKERIDSLDFVEFEKIIFGLMSQELRFVEIIGLFLGMFIGVLQFFITYVIL